MDTSAFIAHDIHGLVSFICCFSEFLFLVFSLFVEVISFVCVNDCSFERFNYTENNYMVPIRVVSR